MLLQEIFQKLYAAENIERKKKLFTHVIWKLTNLIAISQQTVIFDLHKWKRITLIFRQTIKHIHWRKKKPLSLSFFQVFHHWFNYSVNKKQAFNSRSISTESWVSVKRLHRLCSRRCKYCRRKRYSTFRATQKKTTVHNFNFCRDKFSSTTTTFELYALYKAKFRCLRCIPFPLFRNGVFHTCRVANGNFQNTIFNWNDSARFSINHANGAVVEHRKKSSRNCILHQEESEWHDEKENECMYGLEWGNKINIAPNAEIFSTIYNGKKWGKTQRGKNCEAL